MVKIIISGHGDISLGIVDAFEMIFGHDDEVKAAPFEKGEGLPQVQEKFQAEIEKLSSGEEILFLVDVYGGTPYNAAAQVVYGKDYADILTGVNLPIVLEAAANKNQFSLQELVSYLKEIASQSIKSFKEEIDRLQVDKDEEDLL